MDLYAIAQEQGPPAPSSLLLTVIFYRLLPVGVVFMTWVFQVPHSVPYIKRGLLIKLNTAFIRGDARCAEIFVMQQKSRNRDQTCLQNIRYVVLKVCETVVDLLCGRLAIYMT